jgi:hypothetical protein
VSTSNFESRFASFPLEPDLDPIVDGLDEILFSAEVAFGGLNACVAEQQLDLLQFPAGFQTQLGVLSPNRRN